MTRNLNWRLWSRKQIALVAAILILATTGACLSVGVARPKPVTSAVLSYETVNLFHTERQANMIL